MTTRRDVAKAAGVSMRTVSNVVNGYVHVSASTRERVLQAVSELDYRPSELARSLRRGRSGLVGLMLPDLDTPYFAELTRHVVEEGARRGLTVVIDQTDGDLARELSFIERASHASLFDALIVNPLGLEPRHLEGIDPEVPLVLLGERVFTRFDHVMVDNRQAAREAVDHLLDAGRSRVALLGRERPRRASSEQRRLGYLDALAARGRKSAAIIEHVDGFRRSEGAAGMARLLARAEPPDAVFCLSDPIALGALRTLLAHGIRVPEDIALIGFDDIEDGRYSTPSLSTIRPDKSFIARTALDRIERRLAAADAPPGELLVAPHELVIRESSP